MKTNLKVYSVGAFLIFAGLTARAESVAVAQEPFPQHMEDSSLSVALQTDPANPSLGRAWVELSFRQEYAIDLPDEVKVVRKNVPGLQFDSSTQQVIYKGAGASVVCAQVKESRGLFGRSSYLEMTGKCILTSQKTPASREDVASRKDDGFTVRYSPVAQVKLEIKD